MKKIFVLLTLFTFAFLSSCDSNDGDDSQPAAPLKATINGTEVVFDIVKVEKTDYPDDGYSDIQITATKSSDASKTIILELEYEATGTETCFEFQYIDGDNYYIINPRENNSLIVNITENVAKKVKGSFSGTVSQDGGSGSIVVPNGSFDIAY